MSELTPKTIYNTSVDVLRYLGGIVKGAASTTPKTSLNCAIDIIPPNITPARIEIIRIGGEDV